MTSIQRSFASRGGVIRSAITPKLFSITNGGITSFVLTTYSNGILGLNGVNSTMIATATAVGQTTISASIKQGGQHNIIGLSKEFLEFVGRVLYGNQFYINSPVVKVAGVAQQIQLSTYSLDTICTNVTNSTSFYSDGYPVTYILTQPLILQFINPSGVSQTVEILNALEGCCSGGGGGGNVLTYETVSASDAPLSPEINYSIITGAGNHQLGISGASPYQEKTIINAREPVYTPFFKHSYAGVVQAGAFITAGRLWKIIPKPAPSTEVFVIGTFIQDPTGNTNGKGVFKYDTVTFTYTPLGTGVVGQGISNYAGCADGYWDDNTQRLYVTGMFSSAGGVPNTLSVAYWNETASSWNAMGTGLQSAIRGGLAMTPKLDSSGNLLGLYVAGEFSSAGGVANTLRVAFWNVATSTWSALGNGVGTGASSGQEVRRIYYSSILDRLYLSGAFTIATPSSTGTTSDCTFFCYYDFLANNYNPISAPAGFNFNSSCNDFYVDEVTRDIYLAGNFTQTRTSGVATNGLGKWTESLGAWSLWGAGFSTQPIIGTAGQNGLKILKTSTNKLFLLSTGASQPTDILGKHYNYMNTRQYNNMGVWDLTNPSDWDIIANGFGDFIANAIEISPNEYVFCGSAANEVGMLPLTYGSPGAYIFKPDNATVIVFDKIAQGGTNQFMPIAGSPPFSVRCYLTVQNQVVTLMYDPNNNCWTTTKGLNSGALLANSFSSYWSP